MVRPIPEGYHRVTPYLILSNASDAIAFYKAALDASEVMRLDDPSGKVHHAEITIGDSRIMLADEHPELAGCGSVLWRSRQRHRGSVRLPLVHRHP